MPIALIARTWIGNAAPSVVLGAVSLFPSDPHGDASVCKEPRRARVQAHLALARVRRPELGETVRMSSADEQDITGIRADALLPLCGFEVVGKHVLARLKPAHAPAGVRRAGLRDQRDHPAAGRSRRPRRLAS